MTPPLDPKLARAVARWPEADQIDFQERAGVLEYDADMLRGDAEERAFLMVDEARRKAIPQCGTARKPRGAGG